MNKSEGIQEDNEALPPVVTLDEFNAVSSQGLEENQTNRLKAQDNPEFKGQYAELLDDNDRVLYKDWHSDKAGVEFMGSEENMSMMQDKGYEYMLMELSHEHNATVEKYENGEITIDELKENMVDRWHGELVELDEDKYKDMDPSVLDDAVKPYVEAIENAQGHDVKVRFFDNPASEEIVSKPEDDNANVDNERYRVDKTWAPRIEEITDGGKAVMQVGMGHVNSSQGIDEYMEEQGHSVASFRIKNEDAETEEYGTDCYDTRVNAGDHVGDRDGVDLSDDSPDLFYNEQNQKLQDGDDYAKECSVVLEDLPVVDQLEDIAAKEEVSVVAENTAASEASVTTEELSNDITAKEDSVITEDFNVQANGDVPEVSMDNTNELAANNSYEQDRSPSMSATI